jgi:hypothetical protein
VAEYIYGYECRRCPDAAEHGWLFKFSEPQDWRFIRQIGREQEHMEHEAEGVASLVSTTR